jgi:enoyl-[acyl-carrier protein] reductase II
MGLIATADFAAAVSNAGGFGLIGLGLGTAKQIDEELQKIRRLTDRPFGVNVALAFLRDPDAIGVIIDHQVKIITTSAGDPAKATGIFKAAGAKVFHVVPNLKAARKAIEAGVDGLVVEGGEGGGFKNPDLVSTMVLVPLIRDHTELPIVAAGGICDGRGLAAALALGADGIQMGTRFLCSAESPVHANFKNAIVRALETDTVVLTPSSRQSVRTLKTERAGSLAGGPFELADELGRVSDLYFGGDLNASIGLAGQVAGRIDGIKSVKDIIRDIVEEYSGVVGRLAAPNLTHENEEA